MTRPQCIVAADVGNSAIKVCVQKSDGSTADPAETINAHSFSIHRDSWKQDVVGWVETNVGCENAEWRIASVQRKIADDLQCLLSKSSRQTVRRVTVADVPLSTNVEQPNAVGIDRILGALAATKRFDPPVVVVDAGSAITVDFVNAESVFCGGAILPGLRLQTMSLASGTDALPEIQWASESDRELGQGPARNTISAIRLGILMGASGAIDRLIDHYVTSMSAPSEKLDIVLTGGDSTTISRHLRREHNVVENLVCLGLLELDPFS